MLQDLNQIYQPASVTLDLSRTLSARTDQGNIGDAASEDELGNVVYRPEITLAALGRLRHKWGAVPDAIEDEDSDDVTDRTDIFIQEEL